MIHYNLKEEMSEGDYRINVVVAVCLVLGILAVVLALTAHFRDGDRRRHDEYLQDILVAQPVALTHLSRDTAASIANAEHANAQKSILLFSIPSRDNTAHEQESVVLVDVLFKLQVSATDAASSAIKDGDVVKVIVDNEQRNGLLVSVDKGSAYIGYKDSIHLSSKQTKSGANVYIDLSGVSSVTAESNVWITSISESVVQFVVKTRSVNQR